jgi:uncharacterized protein (DUF952 family)
VIYHLLPASTWEEIRTEPHFEPASLAVEGFVHCTGDEQLMLDVANAFYGDLDGPLVLSIDERRLRADVVWEPPAPLPDGWDGAPTFPHVYGPLDIDAVVEVRRLVRDPNSGRYVAYART